MSVCLPDRISHETTCPDVTIFSVHVTTGRGLGFFCRQYIYLHRPISTSSYVDDVMFSHDKANGPESKTTRMLRPVQQAAAPGRSLPSVIASGFIFYSKPRLLIFIFETPCDVV